MFDTLYESLKNWKKMEYLEKICKEHDFTFEIKQEQKKCIQHLLEGHNVMALLPTGFGKSFIYTVYPLISSVVKEKRQSCLVISPLRALMKDQVETMRSKGIKAAAIIKGAESESIKSIKDGDVDIVLASPEVLKGEILEMLRSISDQICLLVFDECHCISEWGLDFRPDYRKVADLVSIFSDCPCLLLTATATLAIQTDIYNVLSLDNSTQVVSVLPDRPNVFIHVEENCKENIELYLNWVLKMVAESQENSKKTIIYCRNLRNCENIYMWLMEELGIKAYKNGIEHYNNRIVEMFHSRTDEKTVERILSTLKLSDSHIRVLCATVAFGLGIDIPDIDIVINWGLPSSAMTFWQEVGRCGRDGRSALGITYPFPRSVHLCPEENFKTIFKGDACYREKVLEMFLLKGMNTAIPKPIECESNSCENCKCGLCMCCSKCFEKCQCSGKVKAKF